MKHFLTLSVTEQYELACNSYMNWYSDPKVPSDINLYIKSAFDGGFDMRKNQVIESAIILQAEGQDLMNEGSFHDAIRKYEESINVAPNIPAIVGLGICYSCVDQYVSAINLFTDALGAASHLGVTDLIPDILNYRGLAIASLIEKSRRLRDRKSIDLVTVATNDLDKCIKLKKAMKLDNSKETRLYLDLFDLYQYY